MNMKEYDIIIYSLPFIFDRNYRIIARTYYITYLDRKIDKIVPCFNAPETYRNSISKLWNYYWAGKEYVFHYN